MSFRVYPVAQTQDVCGDYAVYLDGERVALNTARVSADPINRRWPGHQRQIEQTELVNFLSMTVTGKVHCRVILPEPSEKVFVRPTSAGIVPTVNADGSVEFDIPGPGCYSVEPYGTNRALHIFADSEKTYFIDNNDGKTLYFGPGEHDVGLLELTDGMTLYLDEGAVVYATLHALGAGNIRILGHGILDNSRSREKILFEINAENNDADVGNCERLSTIEIDACKHVEIDGITIRDSLVYNINCVSCEDVRVRNIKLIGNWRFNSDGVHFASCVDCSLEDSFLRVYDDAVVVRGYEASELDRMADRPHFDECRNILVRGNVLWNDWGMCTRIGAASLCREICDVLYEDNDMVHLNFGALDCLLCDFAEAHDFTYRRNRVEYDDRIKQPVIQGNDAQTYADFKVDPDFYPPLVDFTIEQHFEYSDRKYNPDGIAGKVHDMLIEDLDATGRHPVLCRFRGYDEEHGFSGVTMRNIRLNGQKLGHDGILWEMTFAEPVKVE